MRLFLVTVGMLALAGCSRDEAGAGAVRVEVFYATFRPGCLTVTALDEADPSRTETQQLTVDEGKSDTKTVAVFRKADWSRTLRVTASARELSCAGAEVATSSQVVEVPEKGAATAYLDLRAEDLDGDGYVSASSKGTDCDDTDATVHPGAEERCGGKDSNCANGDDDATDKRAYYEDKDGDGYGNSLQGTVACAPPTGWVAQTGDCHDGNPNVRPGRAELLCDGQDEDCDGKADDDFQVGASCEAELGCGGTRMTCSADQTSAPCVRTEAPKEWFVDRDGDGHAGTSAGQSCKAPSPGAVSTQSDCDDASRFRFASGTEVCDGLDNDCEGGVDEGGVCGSHAWKTETVSGESASWPVVTTYAPGKAWLAGDNGRLAHVDMSAQTRVSRFSCAGDWKAAWARPSDGRVFLGGAQGALATTTAASNATCVTASVQIVTSTINGLVGFERNGVTTVYAVTSGGHVLRWEWPATQAEPSAPVEMQRLAANLRSIHGLSPDTLMAVGAEDYLLINPLPRAFSLDMATGKWKPEELPTNLGTGYLRGVSMTDGGLAYAVGDKGLVLERRNGAWSKPASPTGAGLDLLDVVAFHPTLVYVLSNKSNTYLHRFNGTAWSEPLNPTQSLLSLDALQPDELWASGGSGTWTRWGK
ncbi:putative metal-binding motif-containing protein [Archangium violaceum]|uniref:putative metal-binding motif-containing protein n=1 Tax=Archangium violaceum TaxID=83451 RepID=UPI00194F4BB9|nr:putative metal-binding motif-containing protein [Archangium violaceum]QRN93027.1 putative metal-binding motif-containing protein [Archangium violaceum]